ncbi:unnamed protein product, partial [Oppiella nova]
MKDINDFLMDIRHSFDVKSKHVVKYYSLWIEHESYQELGLCFLKGINNQLDSIP